MLALRRPESQEKADHREYRKDFETWKLWKNTKDRERPGKGIVFFFVDKRCQAPEMSKAGCPYDNAPMGRYFNTLKNECTNFYEFATEKALYRIVEEFAYVDYNHVRPHSFNGYLTPYQERIM